MLLKHISLYLFVPFTFLETANANESSMICYNSSLEGFRLQRKALMRKIVSQKIDCVIECATDPCCRSVNYKQTSTLQNETNCEMLHDIVRHNTFDDVLEKNSSFDYVYLINPEKGYNHSCISNDLEVSNGSGLTSCDSIQLMKKGCYKDNVNTRTLPTPLKRYPWGVNWHEGWHDYLYNVTCHCAKLAKNGGHRFFGVQAFEECWAGELIPEFFETKAKAKEQEDCWGVRPNYKECIDYTKTKCVGGKWHNYIYEIISGT